MSKYNIEIIETSSRVITVEANSYEEAENIAEEKYNNSEVVLDYEDLESLNYKPYPSPKLKEDTNINIQFNKYMGLVNINGQLYNCRNKEDLMKSFIEYIDNNLKLEPIRPCKDCIIEKEK